MWSGVCSVAVASLSDAETPWTSGINVASSRSLSYTIRVPSLCEARKRFSDPGSQRISDTGELLIMFCDMSASFAVISMELADAFVDPDVFLRVSFEPHDISAGGTHYHVYMIWAFCK